MQSFEGSRSRRNPPFDHSHSVGRPTVPTPFSRRGEYMSQLAPTTAIDSLGGASSACGGSSSYSQDKRQAWPDRSKALSKIKRREGRPVTETHKLHIAGEDSHSGRQESDSQVNLPRNRVSKWRPRGRDEGGKQASRTLLDATEAQMSSTLTTRAAALLNTRFQTPPTTPQRTTGGTSRHQLTAAIPNHLPNYRLGKRPSSADGSGPCSPSPSKRQRTSKGVLLIPPVTQCPTNGTSGFQPTAEVASHLQDQPARKRPYSTDDSDAPSLPPSKRRRKTEVTQQKLLIPVGSRPRRPLVRQGAIANILWHDFKWEARYQNLTQLEGPPPSSFEIHTTPSYISSQARLQVTTSSSTCCTSRSAHFPLLDLPVELILEVMDRVELTEEVSAFVKSCYSLGRAMAVPYLKRSGAINFTEHSVDVDLQGTSLGIGATLMSYLPAYEFVWLRIGLDTLATYQEELEPFFRNQVIYDMRIRYHADSIFPEDILSVVHTTLRSIDSGLDSLTLETIPPHLPQGPLPACDHPPPRFEDLGKVRKTLRALSISAHWSNLCHFSHFLSNFSGTPRLSTLAVFDIFSEEVSDSVLSPLQIGSHIHNIYLSTTMNSAVNISPFLPTSPTAPRRLSIISIPDIFDPPSCSIPLRLPAWPNIRFTCNFPSLSAADACSLSHLTAVPISKYKSPYVAEYCQILGLFLRSLECLADLPISGVDLCLELPWMISTHLSAQVAGCNCRQASHNFKVPGVKAVGFISDDYSPSAFTYLFQFQDVFVDAQKLYCEVEAVAIEQVDTLAILSVTRRTNSKVQHFSTSDRTWTYGTGVWVPELETLAT